MIAANEVYLPRTLVWARKRSTWHQRAAAVGLIHSTRQHKNFEHIQRITEMLLPSDDDMVQKGLGWLLREAAKANRNQTVPYLMAIREHSPRLCPANSMRNPAVEMRAQVLARAKAQRAGT